MPMLPTTLATNKHILKLRRTLRAQEMLLGGERVLLAVSGGADSMALLDMMARLAPVLNVQLGVAHYNHGLRGDASNQDATFVIEQARLRGIKSFVGRGDVARMADEGKLSVEDAARRARYTFLGRVAQKHRFHVVMTAHNANDNAETLLLNLLRGSGVHGLAAIPAVRPLIRQIVLARPLLAFQRGEIEAYVQEADVAWREDESNASPKYLRNRVRHELLPMLTKFNPSIVATLGSTAAIMRTLDTYLSQNVEQAAAQVVVEEMKDRLVLNLGQLKHYLPAIQTEVLQRTISNLFEIQPIDYAAVDRLLSLLYKDTGARVDVAGGLTAVRERETLVVQRELPPPPPVSRTLRAGESVQIGRIGLETTFVPRESIEFARTGTIEFIDAERIGPELELRSWREGDRFRPLGMEGEKKISDFLIDRKISREKKHRVLVLANDEGVVWVCGLRIDHRYRITDETRHVLRLELTRSGSRRSEATRESGAGDDEAERQDRKQRRRGGRRGGRRKNAAPRNAAEPTAVEERNVDASSASGLEAPVRAPAAGKPPETTPANSTPEDAASTRPSRKKPSGAKSSGKKPSGRKSAAKKSAAHKSGSASSEGGSESTTSTRVAKDAKPDVKERNSSTPNPSTSGATSQASTSASTSKKSASRKKPSGTSTTKRSTTKKKGATRKGKDE